MKNYRCLLIIVLSLLLFNCSKEDDISVPLEVSKYKLSDLPVGDVQKFIYNFQQEYNTLIIVNPDSSDYKYNFTTQNTVNIEPALLKNLYKGSVTVDETATLLYGLNFLDEVFFSVYSEEFKKKYLPVTILLGSKIIEKYMSGRMVKTREPYAYSSYNFIAVSKMDENLKDLSEVDRQILKNEINSSFWYSYLYKNRGILKIPAEFYAPSKEMYGEMEWFPSPMSDLTMLYNLGFINVDEFWWVPSSYYEPAFYPNEEQDVKFYIDYIFSHKKTDFDNLLETYPKIKLKYNILQKTIFETFGFDIREINK